ncbi:hypothetical protein Tco_0777326 [Tanacetum coccineum]
MEVWTAGRMKDKPKQTLEKVAYEFKVLDACLVIMKHGTEYSAGYKHHLSGNVALTSHHNDKEVSVENVPLQPRSSRTKSVRLCDNSGPRLPPRQNVVPTAEKTDSSQQGLEFLFSPLLEEYYNPAHGHAEDNNDDQAPNASFQEAEFINPFCTRGKDR